MWHGFVYHGGFERSAAELEPGARAFHGSGSEHALRQGRITR